MTKYFKIFNEEDNHNGFQYQDGLNVDTLPFASEGSCVQGGFYFSGVGNILKFLDYGNYIREVEIPKGETQWIKDPEEDKWRSHSLFLHQRKYLRNPKTWNWMVEQGIDITASDNYAIRWASENGHLAVVELLLKHGADCTASDNYAIRWASYNGHLAVVELLLKHGADCTADNNYAIFRASANGHLAIVELLHKHGAKLP